MNNKPTYHHLPSDKLKTYVCEATCYGGGNSHLHAHWERDVAGKPWSKAYPNFLCPKHYKEKVVDKAVGDE